MNVGELVKLLAQFSDDTPVILSADSEGNSYSPLADGDECLYEAYEPHSWYMERIYLTHAQLDEYLNSDNTHGYTEEDRAPEDAILALVLWPIN